MNVQIPVMGVCKATKAIRASSHPMSKAMPVIAALVRIDNLKAAIQQALDNQTAIENL